MGILPDLSPQICLVFPGVAFEPVDELVGVFELPLPESQIEGISSGQAILFGHYLGRKFNILRRMA